MRIGVPTEIKEMENTTPFSGNLQPSGATRRVKMMVVMLAVLTKQ